MATVDASIPLGIQLPQLMSPMQAQMQAQTLRQQVQGTQLKNMEIQQGMQSLKDQQELSALAADRSNIDPATGGLTPDALAKLSNPMVRQKLNQDRLGTLQKAAEIKRATSDESRKEDEYKQKIVHDIMEKSYGAGEEYLTKDPKLAQEKIQHAMKDQLDELAASGRGGFSKEQVEGIAAKWLPATPDQLFKTITTHAQRVEEELKRKQADRGEETPFIKETNYLKSLEGKLADLAPTDPAAGVLRKQIGELKQHIAKLDAPARTQLSLNGGPATIQGDALDMAANQLRIDGKLPPGFSRNQANVGAIYKRAAEIAKEKGEDSTAALFNSKSIKSDQNSLTNLTKQSDMITAFESTAKKNLNMLVDQSKKVPRTSFPLLNKAILEGKMQTGDPETAKLYAIVRPFVDEYAKILSGQTGAAGASDTARREAAGIIAGYMSPDQITQLAPFIRQELSNRTSSLDEQRDVIKARMTGGAPKPKTNTVDNPVKPGAATTEHDTAAVAWAKANPGDPRAKKIMELNHGQ